MELFSAGFSFFITFMIFPSITIQKIANLTSSATWNAFILLSSVQVFDFFGRILSGVRAHYDRRILFAFSIARVAFVAISILIVQGNGSFWDSPALILMNAILLGLTNGFFASAGLKQVPDRLENTEKEMGGFFNGLTVNLSITVGSLFSLLFLTHLRN